MTEKVTAKVRVSGAETLPDGQTRLSIQPDYQDGRNQAWAIATPSLNLSMVVKGDVADFFEPGSALTLTFEKSES